MVVFYRVMEEILKKIKQIIEEILRQEFKPLKDLDIPKKQGVYIIKDIKGVHNLKDKIFYVGKSKNIFNRIITQHNSKGDNVSNSILRTKLNRKGLSYNNISEYLENECLFVVWDIEDFDINSLVEDLLIAILRKKKEPLLNSK